MDNLLNNMDFTGGKRSWFDLWHTHMDWDGEGNADWLTREKYLLASIAFYKKAAGKMYGYPHPFQMWIIVDTNDSGEDAVYIHSPNPNEDNYPIKLEPVKNPQVDPEITKLFAKHGFDPMVHKGQEDYYYFVRISTGDPLV